MDSRDFTKRLKKIKSEVLALKQSHEYGLGMAKAYIESATLPYAQAAGYTEFRITITYNTRSTEQPFQLLYFINEEVFGASWNGNTKQYIVAYKLHPILDVNVTVTSLTGIESVRLEAIG